MAYKPTSKTDSLNKKDWKQVLRNFLIFSIPADLAILGALQVSFVNGHFPPTGVELIFALGAGYSALMASLIDILMKFKDENK